MILNEIFENELLLPVCIALKGENALKTSEVIKKLEKDMNPIGNDGLSYVMRRDSIFSQKIRNVISHKNPNFYSKIDFGRDKKTGETTWYLNNKGYLYLENNGINEKFFLNLTNYEERIQFLKNLNK